MTKALITKIVKDSTLDGPGTRYVVFVKGCHLTCPWCHNPETINKKQEVMRYPQFCIQCKQCVPSNHNQGDTPVMPLQFDNKQLEKYRSCVDACPTNAFEYAATEYSADEIIEDAKKYKTVYNGTQGGLTISGGEPLLQPEFALDLFQKAKELGLHTAVDTTATLPWKRLETLLPIVDLWLIDIKHPNDKSLQSQNVIENLLKLSKIPNTPIWIRMPIIPNYNDTKEVWQQVATTLKEAGDAIKFVDLLPFHPYGAAKYKALNLPYQFEDAKPLDVEIMNNAKRVFDQYINPDKVRLGREMVNG